MGKVMNEYFHWDGWIHWTSFLYETNCLSIQGTSCGDHFPYNPNHFPQFGSILICTTWRRAASPCVATAHVPEPANQFTALILSAGGVVSIYIYDLLQGSLPD